MAEELASLAADIRKEHEACEADARSAVEHAIRAGELLIEAKARTKHGEWLPWLGDNFEFTDRTASTYMRLSANRKSISDLPSVNAALAELAVPRTSGWHPPTQDELEAMSPKERWDLEDSLEEALRTIREGGES
jgi:hypothetical protein